MSQRNGKAGGLAILAAAALAATPVAAAAPPRTLWLPSCGAHAPVRLPLPERGKGDIPQGCHAACAALLAKRKRPNSG